ncbi:MAG: M67 family metallopeptidase [Anaerolineae bacterium]|nr:M67 family metallopeptidase [Anaerolineae bacterium]
MIGSPPERLILISEQVVEIVAHARAEYPHEACGLLGGQEGWVEKVYSLPNAEHSPVRYLADPEAQLRAMMEIEERGWEIVAIYHSHPDFLAYPSAADLEMAFYPEALSLILSLTDRERPTLRAFRIREGKIEEVEVRVEERGIQQP